MSEFQHTYSGGESQCSHCGGWTRGANLRTECPTRLRAEVERLRAEVAELRALGVSLHKSAAMGRDAERAAVVRWLRGELCVLGLSPDEKRLLGWASRRIEHAAHHEREE